MEELIKLICCDDGEDILRLVENPMGGLEVNLNTFCGGQPLSTERGVVILNDHQVKLLHEALGDYLNGQK